MNFSNAQNPTSEEIRAKTTEALVDILSQVTAHCLTTGKSAEEAYQQINLITEVFELGRSAGKAEGAAEIFELISQ